MLQGFWAPLKHPTITRRPVRLKALVASINRRRAMPSPIPFSERATCSVAEAQQALGVGRSRLYELIQAGVVRTVRPAGGRQLVVVASLFDLAKREVGA